MLEFLTDKEIYEKVILQLIPQTKEFLWIGTADIKDMYIEQHGTMVPFLSVLNGLLQHKKVIRLIHAKDPGPNFRKDFDKYPLLWKNMERICCPRVHFKTIIVDGHWAYIGSANFTGAGIGSKSQDARNFENGILTDEAELVEKIMEQYDQVWMGAKCKKCKRKKFCGDRIDLSY